MRMKRWISVLLVLSMTLTQLPVAALADGEFSEVAEMLSEEILTEEADEENTEETVEEQEFFMAGVPSVEIPDNDELYNGYVYQQFYGEIATYGTLAREHLNDVQKAMYDYLKAEIEKIAAGERTSTIFEFSSTQLKNFGAQVEYSTSDRQAAFNEFLAQLDMKLVNNALLADCPYDMYWQDKVGGWSSTGTIGSENGKTVIKKFIFRLDVADNYQGSDEYTVSTNATAIITAVKNAQSLVNRHASKSDYEKLLAYKNEICNMVDYNYDAAAVGKFSEDNDPWQLVYVFDGNDSTKVVCEGYAKSMQYLCELSSFNGNVYCYSVSGFMNGGAHMWNIVEIEGKNYLLDVTNSEKGTSGQNGEYFLAGGSGSVNSGYTVGKSTFKYRDTTIDLWGEEALTLSSTKYVNNGSAAISIRDASITIAPEEMTYTGSALIPEVTVQLNGVTLTEGKDYTLAFSNNIDIGTASVLVSGKGSYTGNVTAEFEIVAAGIRGECGDNLTWVLYKDGELVISGEGAMYDWYDEDTPWYSHREKIRKVVIEEGVSSIGSEAFYDCDNMTSITIPKGVTGIGHAAFYDCVSLTSVTIPEGVISIGGLAFYNCHSLASITIPEGVTSIGNSTFYFCSSLENIAIPASVTSIGNYAFHGCSNLAYVTIPEGVTSIGIGVFYYCSSLVSVVIPEGITNIGSYMFSHCGSLKSVTIPESVTRIGSNAFSYCNRLVSITIPESVTDIGDYAFYDCNGLTSITIPEGISSIGESMFYDCNLLESITIPESVFYIGKSAFYNCSALTDVYYAGSEAQWNVLNVNKGNDPLLNATIHFGAVSETVVGDANGDDEINSADVNLLYRAIMGYTELSNEQISAADVNNDGKVDSADVNLLYRYVMGYVENLRV